MSTEWVITTLLTLVNATGIPLLAAGIIFLIFSYQKSISTYRETSKHLAEENERIRKRLTEADMLYFGEVEKMRAIVTGSVEAIKELQARKISLLSNADENAKEVVLSDVEKINEAIEELRGIADNAKNIDTKVREVLFYLNHDFQELTTNVSELADQISDTKSRVAIVGVITSSKAYKELLDEAKKGQGIKALPYEKKKKQLSTSLGMDSLESRKIPKLSQSSED